MAGFDCHFVEQPPEFFQTHCPVCLLVLREPCQAECCGKSFCKECVREIKARSLMCPTCKSDRWKYFHNKGLQQPLYGFRVFCSNKESGCAWEGELGQLDQHINSNPDKEKQLVGCRCASIPCLYCEKLHPRHTLEEHQASVCLKRPFTCKMCGKYSSTYENVINSHTPVCEHSLVPCPNSCGASNMKLEHLQEHMSNQCPLTLVECTWAGCATKVYRKDLRSHFADNVVAHMLLLAKENRKLKLQLREKNEQIEAFRSQQKQHSEEMAVHKIELEYLHCHKTVTHTATSTPPVFLSCPASILKARGVWHSRPFYSHKCGYELWLTVISLFSREACFVELSLGVSKFKVQPFSVLRAQVILSDCMFNKLTVERAISCGPCITASFEEEVNLAPYVFNNQLLFRVTRVDFIL